MDDIISFGTTFDDSLDNLTLIFEQLECDPRKIEDVKMWPVPDCLKKVRQFLGFVGYYGCFIPSFADLAEPLVALTGKDVPFIWRPACAAAFTKLRDAMAWAPILAFPTESGDYVLDTRTAPYHPESDGMVERFNRTCLMMLSMFVNDRRDNWHELLPFVMHAYRTNVHESTWYSPFRLMMGE